jgi:protein-S-isoprenylcysteine O-methyltransferase Ste14
VINILLAIAAYGIFHSLTASPPFKRLMRRWMGAAYHRSYRLIYNFFSVVTLIPILLTVRLHPGLRLYQLALPWTLATTALQLAGLLIVVFGLIQTGPFQFMGLRQLFGSSRQDEEVLAISGLHGWVRHPLYTGGLLFIWANACYNPRKWLKQVWQDPTRHSWKPRSSKDSPQKQSPALRKNFRREQSSETSSYFMKANQHIHTI